MDDEGPAVSAHRFKCARCELPTNAQRCFCGGSTLRLIDRRPVRLSDALRDRVEEALSEAIVETRSTEDATRARLLRQLVIPHFLRVLGDHDRAEARRRRGEAGYRELEGSLKEQLAVVSRLGMARLRRGKVRKENGATDG